LDAESVVELRWTLALEAALFFSLHCWIMTVDRAWPGDNSWQFALSLLMGASSAVVLCHLIPALCEPTIELLWRRRAGRILLFPFGIWLSLGAVAALFEMATATASMLVLWRDLPLGAHHQAWQWLARCLALVCVLASLVTAAIPRWSCLVASVCLGVGFSLAVAGFFTQSSALHSTNPQMRSEDGLGDSPASVASGMLLASAPAAILGLRIGRMRLPFWRVVSTGFWGVWLPVIASVTLVSVAKMCGVRLYWKPSLPLDWTWAFVWLSRMTDQTAAAALLPLTATLAAPLLIVAMWITDIGRNWPWNWRKVTAIAAAGVGGYYLKSPALWESASRSWLWSIILASLVLGAIQSLIWMRQSVTRRQS
jgi:hypothetical protein